MQRQFYTAEKITLKLNVLCAIYCLGPETKHTVYKGKIASAIMAQELLHKQLNGFSHHVSMYIDNQASILATQTKACNPATTYLTSYTPNSPEIKENFIT